MKFDVVVVGGGLVGATLACRLGQSGIRVALCEATVPAALPEDGTFDLRVSALTRASRQLLEAIGAWQRIPAARCTVFREMRVWDATGDGNIHFDAADIGADALGYVVENRVIQSALEQTLLACPNVEQFRPATMLALQRQHGQVTVLLRDTRLRARLVVGADGANSLVRQLAGIEISGGDYQQSAVVATVVTGAGHGGTAWQRFFPTGPLALLPLPGSRVSIVWTTTPGQAQQLLGCAAPEFCARLHQASDDRLGAILSVEGRASFALGHSRARAYVAERIALVGDAAHRIHPLAGQGVNLGLLDVAALTEVIEKSWLKQRDIGLEYNLRPYERWRKGHNWLMQGGMSGFKQLFGSRLAPVRAARNFGLSATDRAPALKRLFMRFASGDLGDNPVLARPPTE